MTSSGAAPTPDRPDEGRAAHVISQIYYYVAAVIGFGLFMGGAIGALFGLRIIVLPRELETSKEGVEVLLQGLAFAIPGIVLVWWHVRQARQRETSSPPDVFWGPVLYYFLMALVALLFAIVGVIGVLSTTAEAVSGGRDSQDLLEQAVDFAIFLIAAGPVFWWHLRQGRRLTAPPDEP